LKRIEKEAPPQDESHPWPRPIDSKKAVKAKVKKRWLINRLVSALIILLVVLAAGWLAFSQRHLIFAKLQPEKSREGTRQGSTSSLKKKPVHQAKIKTPPAKKTVNTIAQKSATSSRIPKPKPGAPVQKNLTRRQTVTKPMPVKKKTPLKSTTKRMQPLQPSSSRRTPVSASTNPRSTSAPASANVAGEGNSRFDTLSAIDDSKLKLQAIAWSDDAARRMAVINNHIVREGEAVDGFSITKIREDDVIVNDGTTSWRVKFSLKQ
jgi:hypothetical protein